MKFFVTHYTPLIERKAHIIEQFQKYNITNYTFIETYDRENLKQSDLNKFSHIRLSEISLFLKHI